MRPTTLLMRLSATVAVAALLVAMPISAKLDLSGTVSFTGGMAQAQGMDGPGPSGDPNDSSDPFSPPDGSGGTGGTGGADNGSGTPPPDGGTGGTGGGTGGDTGGGGEPPAPPTQPPASSGSDKDEPAKTPVTEDKPVVTKDEAIEFTKTVECQVECKRTVNNQADVMIATSAATCDGKQPRHATRPKRYLC